MQIDEKTTRGLFRKLLEGLDPVTAYAIGEGTYKGGAVKRLLKAEGLLNTYGSLNGICEGIREELQALALARHPDPEPEPDLEKVEATEQSAAPAPVAETPATSDEDAPTYDSAIACMRRDAAITDSDAKGMEF
ncbi:MAG: hypothetical protein AAF721_00280 [Myxococcota bacterium]